jgi:polysaccharide export outer membrane protein
MNRFREENPRFSRDALGVACGATAPRARGHHAGRVLPRLLNFVFLGLAAFECGGCFGKSFTKPYSTVVDEAQDEGRELPSGEAENARFDQYEKEQIERLASVIKDRLGIGLQNDTYKVGVADTLKLSVFDVPELDLTVSVNDAGYVTLPLVGSVQFAGLTISECEKRLTKELSSYVRNPQVLIGLSEFGSQKVAVLGSVAKPGSYPLKKGATAISDIISEAGGPGADSGNFVRFLPVELTQIPSTNDPAARAQLAVQTLLNQGDERHLGVEVPLNRLIGTSGALPLEIPVRGGDVVIVPEAGRVSVDGEVEKRGTVDITRGLTLMGALASAGGITWSAKFDEVELLRNAGGQTGRLRKVVNLEQLVNGAQEDILLKSGDIIRVPSLRSRRIQKDTYDTINSFFNFGVGGQMRIAQ